MEHRTLRFKDVYVYVYSAFIDIQIFGVGKIFERNKCVILISKDELNWSKLTVKKFIMLKNIYIKRNADILNNLFLLKYPEKNYKIFTKILNCTTVFHIDNNNISWATNQFRIITGINCILKYIKIDNSCYNISQCYCIFHQTNAWDFFKNLKQSYWPQTFEQLCVCICVEVMCMSE